MRYGSVCSGIEAATVAWEPLGWKAAWFAEIEPFPCAVLAHHYPNVPNYGDMTKLARRVLAGEIEAPDVLVGGTPCQAYSVAGMRAGLNDERGQLTLRFMELADAIDHVRARAGKPPCIIVWENVLGVLSDKTNAFGCFLAGLAGEDVELVAPGGKWSNAGCVYGPQRAIAWRTLDAQYFGVAQRRRRVFLVASARNGFDPATILFEWDGLRRDTPPRREPGQVASSLTSTGVGTCGADDNQAQAGHLLPVASTGDISHCLNAGGMGRQDYETETVIVQSVALRGREGGATAELGGDLATTLRCGGGGGDKPHVLAPVTQTGDITHTLKADGFDGSEDGTGRGQPIVAVRDVAGTITSNYGKQVDSSDTSLGPNVVFPGMAVRRLTPRECERLQAFEDDYTKVPYKNKPSDQCPDGPRYKALGNSMCTKNMRWIGRRIQSVDDLTRSVKQAA